MDLKEIQNLIKFVSESGVDEVDIEKKDFKISIRKAVPVLAQAPQQIVQATVPVSTAVSAAPVPVVVPETVKPAEAPAATDHLITVKSPMIGTFYRSASPDKPPFVNVGDEIAPGTVVCIVEAMKLFNEIESEVSGKIVKILVDNATPVEYDQPLFLIEPK
jgi:acetyl-CoA carboxylase biotin carboxyl carrier protein